MYYLRVSGAMATGWLKQGGIWYWLDRSSGAMGTGWYRDGSTWYYSDGSGAMLANRWLKQAGTWYYLNPSGSMRTGWFKQHGVWYWLNPKAAPWLLDGRRRLMEVTTSTDPARCLPIDGLTWAAHGMRSAHQAHAHRLVPRGIGALLA